MKFLICQYSHIEGYPPTFNAINVLAKEGHAIQVLSRKDLETKWDYSKNVTLNFIGNYKNRFEFEKTSKFHKIKEFIIYVKTLLNLINKTKPDIVLLYDNIPLMAYRFIRLFVNIKHKVWYHNHDNHYLKDYVKYTLNYFAYFSEKKSFKFIDIFTLPQKERLRFFHLKKYKGKQFVIPNYPPKYLFDILYDLKNNDDIISLIYPGNINENLGIEEVIQILDEKFSGKSLQLNLVGDIRKHTKERFIEIAKKQNVSNKISFHDRISYLQIPSVISQNTIGLAMYKPVNLTYAEAGTAANKIYEYAACGLPTILLNTRHYYEHLGQFGWTFFTDLSSKSLIEQISKIIDDYDKFKKVAIDDFKQDLYFEKHFLAVVEEIIKQ